jgi:hypothetical protein
MNKLTDTCLTDPVLDRILDDLDAMPAPGPTAHDLAICAELTNTARHGEDDESDVGDRWELA